MNVIFFYQTLSGDVHTYDQLQSAGVLVLMALLDFCSHLSFSVH